MNNHTSLIASLYASTTPSLNSTGTRVRIAATDSLTSGIRAGGRPGAWVASLCGRRLEKMDVAIEMPRMRPMNL